MEKNHYEKPHPKARILWIISGAVFSIITMAIAYVIYYFLKSYVGYWPLIITGIFSFFITLIHPFIEYNQWSYCITEEKVEYNHGIYYTKKSIIPISRIQHLDLSQGPLQKLFKFSSVKIYTAGMTHTIEDIPISKAEVIAENLNKLILKVNENEDIQ
ncbi:PH domain-containing protein [Dethiothermospora halolimnae]|uniref:PH domain-containing protein n=1 Tax=Dethiothermospora halolimnae TaxID=3114390 RepID=UPI003CCBDD19